MRRSSEKLRVTFDTHLIPPQGRITRQVDLRNVMAILPGRSPRRIYVSAAITTRSTSAARTSRMPRRLARRRRRRRSPDAPIRSQRRGQRRQRRWQRHGADDGAGAGVCGERHPVRRDAGVHLLGGRGAGPDRLARARHGPQDRADVPVEAVFNNDIVGNSQRRQRLRRCGVGTRLCDRSRGFAGALAGAPHPARPRQSTCRRIASG